MTSENIENINSSISHFFRPKPKPIGDKGANHGKSEGENDVIVLNDDSDDDLCSGNSGIVDRTKGLESDRFSNEGGQTIIEIDQDDQHCNEQSSESSLLSQCDEDIARDKTKKTSHENRQPDADLKHSETLQNCTTNQDNPSSPQKSSMVAKDKENPFAKFAYGSSTASERTFSNTARTIWKSHSSSTRNKKRASSGGKSDGENQYVISSKKIHTCSKDEKKKEKEFVKMKDQCPEDQDRVIRKWHSMADPSASPETRRYQVLLAARLHARCQEPTVRKAMGKLKEHFAPLSESKTITVEEMAKSNPEDLASHISSLQFYNVKAKQIVLAAQEIMSRHGGIVPEDECSLLQITGIGKTFADLLAFVNTRETHRRVDS